MSTTQPKDEYPTHDRSRRTKLWLLVGGAMLMSIVIGTITGGEMTGGAIGAQGCGGVAPTDDQGVDRATMPVGASKASPPRHKATKAPSLPELLKTIGRTRPRPPRRAAPSKAPLPRGLQPHDSPHPKAPPLAQLLAQRKLRPQRRPAAQLRKPVDSPAFSLPEGMTMPAQRAHPALPLSALLKQLKEQR